MSANSTIPTVRKCNRQVRGLNSRRKLFASVDKNLSVNLPSGPTPFTNTFHPTIEQGGIFYFASIPGPSLPTGPGGGQTGYNTIGRGLTAADFTEFDFTTGTSDGTHPNLPAARCCSD